MSIFVSGALVLAKQHFTIVKKSCKIMYFQELFIWLAPEHQLSQLIDAPEHQFWSRCFMSMFIGGALVLTKQHFTIVKQSLQNHVFSRIVHLASTRAPVIAAHRRLLEPWPESHQIELPGTGFVDFWSQGQKVRKQSLLGPPLSTS